MREEDDDQVEVSIMDEGMESPQDEEWFHTEEEWIRSLPGIPSYGSDQMERRGSARDDSNHKLNQNDDQVVAI
jgi:hypothetical protein